MKRLLGFLMILGLALAPAAAGPLGGIGALPGQTLGRIGQTTGQLGNGLDNTVQTVQRDLVGRPVGANAFDRDVSGARVLKRTVLMMMPSASDLAIAGRLGFEVVRNESLSSLGVNVVQLRAPGGMDSSEALDALRKADPAAQLDYDHIYDPTGESSAGLATPTSAAAPGVEAKDAHIGMIDGGIAVHHPAFDNASIETRNFASLNASVPTAHGTAIASLLVGRDDEFRGCIPGASLFAADVYGGEAGGGGAMEIAGALNWMAANGVPVVNVSLAGPANKLLELATKRYMSRGGVVVAAVGNAGPAAPLSYPAGYAGVVGVTAVDSGHRPLIDAGRGDVMFAALGADIRAAKPERGFASYTGTSFAAPVVTARVALLLPRADVGAARSALERLRGQAVPLPLGKDAVGFGYLDPPATATFANR